MPIFLTVYATLDDTAHCQWRMPGNSKPTVANRCIDACVLRLHVVISSLFLLCSPPHSVAGCRQVTEARLIERPFFKDYTLLSSSYRVNWNVKSLECRFATIAANTKEDSIIFSPGFNHLSKKKLLCCFDSCQFADQRRAFKPLIKHNVFLAYATTLISTFIRQNKSSLEMFVNVFFLNIDTIVTRTYRNQNITCITIEL